LFFQFESHSSYVDNKLSSPSIHTEVTSTQPVIPTPPIRRSQKTRGPLVWLKGFLCPLRVSHKATTTSICPISPSDSPSLCHNFVASSSTSYPYPLSSYANLAHLTPNYVASLANVLQYPKPSCYAQAQQCPKWVATMDLELAAFEQNHT